MTNELTALKVAFEEEDMSPEEIASDRGLDVSAVKAGLMQVSSKYRKSCLKESESEDNLNFTKEEQGRIMDVIRDLALGADDENLRFKAAVYIRDDFKGRKDIVKGMNGQQFNILMINERMKQVRSITDNITQKVIET